MSENRTRFRLDQRRAPIYEALERFRQMRVVPFDVPGHKRGRGNPELTAFLGQQCVGVDVNSMKPLDNLCHPVSVIREAEELAADAFGADGLVLVHSCADPWSPKTVRATMGACFRLPVWEADLHTLQARLDEGGVPLYATALREDTEDLRAQDLRRCAVVIGSEGRGVSEETLALCGKTLKIPMRTRCESLNAAVAGAVVLWEMAR